MKIKLLPKFILSLGVIGVILTIAISLFSYRSSRSYLEKSICTEGNDEQQ